MGMNLEMDEGHGHIIERMAEDGKCFRVVRVWVLASPW